MPQRRYIIEWRIKPRYALLFSRKHEAGWVEFGRFITPEFRDHKLRSAKETWGNRYQFRMVDL